MKNLLVSLFLVLSLVSCGNKKGSDASSGEKIFLRIAHNAAASDIRTPTGEVFLEKLGELTDGRITGQIFPAGQLGDSREVFEGLQLGTVDIAMVEMGELEPYGNMAAMSYLLYLYRDESHFNKVWDESTVGQEIVDAIKDQTGFLLLGAFKRPQRHVTSIKPLNTAQDFRGLKLRTPNTPIMLDGFKAIGASPMPMNFTEVFNALERKVIDAEENPFDIINSQSFHQVSPYVILTGHAQTSAHFVFWDEKFKEYPQDIQDAILEAADFATDYYNTNIDRINREALATIKEYPGVQVTELPANEKAILMERARSTFGNYPHLQDLIKKIDAVK